MIELLYFQFVLVQKVFDFIDFCIVFHLLFVLVNTFKIHLIMISQFLAFTRYLYDPFLVDILFYIIIILFFHYFLIFITICLLINILKQIFQRLCDILMFTYFLIFLLIISSLHFFVIFLIKRLITIDSYLN